jgi:hypothetical protein
MSTAISPLIAAGSRFPLSTGQPDTDEKLSPIHLRSTGLLPMTRQDGVVLVIADAIDSTADWVCDALVSRGGRLFRFNTAEFPGKCALITSRWSQRPCEGGTIGDHVEPLLARFNLLKIQSHQEIYAYLDPAHTTTTATT